ncbi:type III polyketide synthase [Mucilaginibacter sp. Bleaf8]|uniref:type III polyketide synthase n=1 Tax=Mucilaginibacter sp. Bleaf8 TaxID=2834430 RepID=UPI001BCD5051|nr:type III polyketide synthase [Mucilaginibacter sp. Bleaf8]MBS7566206.1 type III polyketide synthase [Mucilaginibacter sp. Bleaf8]
MGSCISAIGIANPPNKVSQQDAYHFMVQAFGLNTDHAARLKSIYDNSAIENRYSVIEDFGADRADYTFFEPTADLEPFVTTEKRMQAYQTHAIQIALQATRNCLANFNIDVTSQITHLVTVSCTGMYAPGIDIDLVEQLGLPRTTERICINFMGCYGAINGIKTADYICRANPNAKVLVVSVELCTLHFQKHNTLDNWVANSLFADGSAVAFIENAGNKLTANPGLELESFYSEFMPESRDEMAWYVGNTGFEMKLTSKVPKQIKKHIRNVTDRLLQKADLPIEQIGAYAIHPGGRKILEAVEEALDLPEESNGFAYEVLRQYGNMSSATILFVLQKMMYAGQLANQHILSFAFGPGLTVEGMVLKMQ